MLNVNSKFTIQNSKFCHDRSRACRPDEVFSRARAAFLGLALGDALGATTEFMTPGEIRARFKIHRKIVGGGWLHLKAGEVTDDTEMSLAIARALVLAGGWELRGIADNFVAWMRGKPVDIGATCRKGIRNYMLDGVLETPYNEWDAGNGAVMRMAPVALFTLGDEELLTRCAVEQAHITHHHPLSDAACVTVGRMVQRALLGADRFALHALTRELVASPPQFPFQPLSGARRGLRGRDAADRLPLPVHHRGFRRVPDRGGQPGGDADTTGAIAGMIAGAFYGLDSLPPKWLKKLNPRVREELDDLAVRLVRLSPWSAAGAS